MECAGTRLLDAPRANPFQQFVDPAGPVEAAFGALQQAQQFERVDAELDEERAERLRALRGRDRLFLIDPGQRQVEFDLGAPRPFAARALLRFDRRLHRDAAHDVVVADVEVDVGRLQGLLDFALRFFQLRLRRQRAGGFQLFAAGRVFAQFDRGVDSNGDVEIAAHLCRAGTPDLGAAAVPWIFHQVGELYLVERFLAGDHFAGLAFNPGPPLDQRPDEVEGGRIDFVLALFVADVRLVPEQRQAAVEVDL